MREIKFRAWKHVNTPEMFNDVQAIGFISGIAHLGYRLSSYTVRTDKESLDNLILMQYTGLTDKNGKEIYEGDIVELHQFLFDGYGEVENELMGQVVYQESTSSFALDKTNNKSIKKYMGYEGDEEIGPLPIFLFHGIHEESFTVIGNIFENPELLENDCIHCNGKGFNGLDYCPHCNQGEVIEDV